MAVMDIGECCGHNGPLFIEIGVFISFRCLHFSLRNNAVQRGHLNGHFKGQVGGRCWQTRP